jgi:hypothetical protein
MATARLDSAAEKEKCDDGERRRGEQGSRGDPTRKARAIGGSREGDDRGKAAESRGEVRKQGDR